MRRAEHPNVLQLSRSARFPGLEFIVLGNAHLNVILKAQTATSLSSGFEEYYRLLQECQDGAHCFGLLRIELLRIALNV